MSRRRSRRCRSSRAPARSSIRMTSHVARSASSNSPTRMQVGDRVSRRYSTQAEVSTRIIYAPAHFVEIAVPPGSAHLAGFIEAESLRCKRAQGEIDGFLLGREMVLPHDRCASFVVDIHVSACHAPIVHHEAARCCSSLDTGSVRKRFVSMAYSRLGASLTVGSSATEP